MSNEGRISTEFSDELQNQVLKLLDDLYKLLPAHVSLSDDERKGGFKLGDKTSSFLEKGKTYMEQAPQFIPAYTDKAETFRDANYTLKMLTIVRKMQPILTEIEDMATIAGVEALSSVLSYYNNVRDAANKGIPGAKDIYEDLKKRFPGRPKGSGTNDATKVNGN